MRNRKQHRLLRSRDKAPTGIAIDVRGVGYSPHLEVSLPTAFEAAIYGDVRSVKESFDDYVIRMEYAFKELERQGAKLAAMSCSDTPTCLRRRRARC